MEALFTLSQLADDSPIDAILYLSSKDLADLNGTPFPEAVAKIAAKQEIDQSGDMTSEVFNGKLVLHKNFGDLKSDYLDARSFFESAKELAAKAVSAGKSKIAFICNVSEASFKQRIFVEKYANEFANYKQVAVLGALEAVYKDLQTRERPEYQKKVIDFFVHGLSDEEIKRVQANEEATVIGRDLGGADPERMSAKDIVEYVTKTFGSLKNVELDVISDQKHIAEQYPMFQCVNRANAERHRGRIIRLEYRAPDQSKVKQHLAFVGKGITYDTGGADIKAGGIMAGMHRDKCGACNVIGFMWAVSKLSPENLNVTVYGACVRNSVGSEGYVADEVVRSRAGKYCRIVNTDAEGRMAMVDVLCKAKERAIAENWIVPRLFTVATLTGHVCIAFDDYTAVLENGPSMQLKTADQLIQAGHKTAQPFEQSSIRREDYKASTATDGYADVIQCGTAASSRTPRGHQQPAGFLVLASGLDAHGLSSEKPIAYTHLDIAGSAGPYPGLPTGAPIRAFIEAFL